MDRALAARRAGVAFALATVAGSTLSARADEDVRKLADRQPPVVGSIWRQGIDAAPRGEFDSSGITMLARIPLNNFAPLVRGSGNDCWGYVSPSGREYAIMGVEGGYGFVEVTNPSNPQIVATVAGPNSLWHDVKVIGQYAYGVSEGGSGVQVMNLANIDNGVVTLVRNWTSGGYSTTHNIVANTEAGTLWVVGANIGNGGLIHLDISNPALPALDGGWTEMYVHDAQVVTWHDGALAGHEIAFCASGFSGGFSSTGMRVVDVTNPNNPQVLATIFYPSSGYSHQVWLSDDRQYLYLNDELDEGSTVSVTTTRVINVADPANPFFVGTFTTGLPSIDHNLYTRDGLIFQANYRSGLRVFDALDPVNPTQIAYFDTYPGSDSAEFNGAWSNYPFFPSGTIIVSDIERGLFVLRLDAQPAALAVSVEGATPEFLNPAGGDTIHAHTVARSPENPVTGVELMIDTGSGFEAYPASETGDGSWEADTPVVPCGSTVRAYFRATTLAGDEAVYPADAPAQTLNFEVASSETVAFSDNFQTSTGWAVSGNSTSAANGRWERAIPAGAGSRGAPASDYDGSGFCYVTGNGADNSDTDVDGGNTILTSPALDTTGDGDAYVSYARWYSNTAGGSPNEDIFTVQISANNGSTWTTVEVVGPSGPETSGGWFAKTMRVADYITPTANTRVRFIAEDASSGSVVEAAVDAVEVTYRECTDAAVGCSFADIAEPFGTVDFFDVSAFLTAYNAQDPVADVAAPFGAYDFFDVSAFLTMYNNGCP